MRARAAITAVLAIAALVTTLKGDTPMTEPSTLQGGGQVADSRLDQVAADAAVQRMGVVVRYDSATITVRISGSDVLVDAARLRDYTPILGDVVVVLRSGATWVVLGALNDSVANNEIVNPSFEADTIGAVPANWGVHQVAGAAIVSVQAITTDFADGSRVLAVENQTPSTTAVTAVYSEALPVQGGQRWTAAAYARAAPSTYTPPPVALQLFLSWYADVLDVYPNTNSPDSVAATWRVWEGSPFVLMSPLGDDGGIEVPADAKFMRVVLYTSTVNDAGTAQKGAHWDRIIARRIS